MNCLSKYTFLIMVAGAITALPLDSKSQPVGDKNASEHKSSESAEPAQTEKKPKAGPFHGKLVAIDKIAKTITVGKRTFLITSETKIKKAGKPATLDDGAVGEEVSGYVKPREDGKLAATTVNFGPRAEPGGKEKKSKDSEKAAK